MAGTFDTLLKAFKERATKAFAEASTRVQSFSVSLSPFALQASPQDPRETRPTPLGSTPPKGEILDLPVSIWGDWTIQRIKAAVSAHVLGNFGPASLLVESMLGDDRIQGATQGRLKAVTKCEPVFTPAEQPGSEDLAQQIADELETLWEDIVPEETLEAILTWSTFLYFAVIEKIWELRTLNGELRYVPRLKVWHPLYVYYDIQKRAYIAITQDGIIPVIPGDPKWILYTPGGQYRGWMRGAVRSCSIPWVVRQFALRDWGRFSEKHGLPLIVSKVPAQSSAEDKARFFSSIKNLGSDSAIQMPSQGGQDAANWDIQLIEARDTSWKAFPGLIAACDQSITLSIRGTNLTTAVEGGSYAAAQSHRDEDSDLSISDRRKLASCLKRQLIDQYVAYNYGSAALSPTLSYVSPESNPKDEADTLLKVSQAMTGFSQLGWPIDRQLVSDKFGLPLKEVDEQKADEQPSIVLAPTDLAAIISVNEARAAQHLEPLTLPDGSEDPDGALTIEAYRSKSSAPKPGTLPSLDVPGPGLADPGNQ